MPEIIINGSNERNESVETEHVTNCSTCYHGIEEGEQITCRRYPPSVFPIPGVDRFTNQPVMQMMTVFPVVNESMDCGEYEDHPDE